MSSQIETETAFTVVKLTYVQVVMHFESALLTKLGEAQAEQM